MKGNPRAPKSKTRGGENSCTLPRYCHDSPPDYLSVLVLHALGARTTSGGSETGELAALASGISSGLDPAAAVSGAVPAKNPTVHVLGLMPFDTTNKCSDITPSLALSSALSPVTLCPGQKPEGNVRPLTMTL